ncbi:hypothetical protein MMC07_001660 [Pseudocyphellaria aurata]|nr:hypothetical protein [Pseudocyphellaria aurata]
MGYNCNSVADTLQWATCQVLTWIINLLWSLFVPVLACTLTVCYHAKAAGSPEAALDSDANGETPVLLPSVTTVWSWRLMTLLIYVPQSYLSFMVMRWTVCWMLDVLEPKFLCSKIPFLLIVLALRAILFIFALVVAVVLLVHLLLNTVDAFIVRNQNHVDEEESSSAVITERSSLLGQSRALELGDPAPVVHTPDRRPNTDSSASFIIVNNYTPPRPSTRERPDSPPFSESIVLAARDSSPDFNPYGISWLLGPWNFISIMLWIRACSQASADLDLERVSDDLGGEHLSSSPLMPHLIADESSSAEPHEADDEHNLPSYQSLA